MLLKSYSLSLSNWNLVFSFLSRSIFFFFFNIYQRVRLIEILLMDVQFIQSSIKKKLPIL